ncbi:hypothetical protein lerEdw1_006408 [Lerista edwardsae]|nr:hypothetical protein lerEdw1_006408 [Lerista edwardsae]
MELWGVLWLLLARISLNRAQLKRQRTGAMGPTQGIVQELTCPMDGGEQEPASVNRDCPYPLLPWALLLALVGVLALYLLFARGQRGAEPGPEGDASLERALLRDIASVLHVIRPRLWQIAQAQQQQRRRQRSRDRGARKGH